MNRDWCSVHKASAMPGRNSELNSDGQESIAWMISVLPFDLKEMKFLLGHARIPDSNMSLLRTTIST